jgi:N-acetyl sugar amidotransferase
MDTSDADITFDSDGICCHCRQHESKASRLLPAGPERERAFGALVDNVRSARVGEYDCIVGLSGGVDSSYVAHLAVKHGLRPLAVHFDNGWNSELAVKNIETLVGELDLDLMTFVIDWEEFRDIQRSFFAAGVIDIEMVTDHAIFAALYQLARKHRIRYILAGTNVATEAIMPTSWQHFKFDLRNLLDIQRRFGTRPIRRFPTLSIWSMAGFHYTGLIKSASLLNYLDYSKTAAIATLQREFGWQYYGGKHYESLFTKFYQAHILPVKFGIDKRRAHLSDLIMNEETTREESLRDLDKPRYDQNELERDTEYVCKKLGFTREEFSAYLARPPVLHATYKSYAKFARPLVAVHKYLRYRI